MELTNKKRNMIFMVIVVTCILCSLLSTALTTALPKIMEDFQINEATGQWLTSIYSLVQGILVLATAYFIKRFKTKPLYLTSLGIFTVGIILNAFTNSFSVMMAGRVLQAAGNGILLALGQVILLTIYEKERRGSVMGIYGLAVSAAPVVAPTLAGFVVDAFGWRMIFYILLVICILALIVTMVTFENVLENEKVAFDTVSMALCIVGFGGLLLGVGNIGKSSFVSLEVIVPLVLGLAGGGVFVHRQLHMEQPFLELRILKSSQYTMAVIASMILYAYLMGFSVLAPVYIQRFCGFSATVSGMSMMPGAIVMALMSPIAGKLYDKWGMKRVFALGVLFMVGSSAGMMFLREDTPLMFFTVLNVFRSVFTAMLMMPFVTWGMNALKKEHTAAGTSLLTSLRTIAGAFGSALIMVVVSMAGITAAFAGMLALGAAQLLLFLIVWRRKYV